MIELMNTKCTLSIDVGQFAVQMRCSGECSACAGTAQGYNAKKTARTAKTAQTAAKAAAAAKAAGAASMQRIAELMMRPLRRHQEMLHHLRIIQEALDTPPIQTPPQNPFVAKKSRRLRERRTTASPRGASKDPTIAKKKPAVKKKKG
jgi:hypothetical protein